MLPSQHRLGAHRHFQRVYQQGRSWAHPLLALHVLEGGGERTQLIGVSVSRKVGGAVVRNRVRRRLHEAVRSLLPGWHHGFRAVIVARAGAAEADFAALRAALEETARRARLAREPVAAPDSLYQWPAGGRPGAVRGRGRGSSGPAQEQAR